MTGGRARRAGLVAGAIVAVALVVVAVVLVLVDRRSARSERLAREAVVAAETAAVAVLDYRPDTVVEDLTAAEPLLTRPFLDTFRQQSREVTVPRATAGQVSSWARTAGAALTSIDPGEAGEAGVVVYLDRHTVDADAIPRVLQTVVEVGLVRDGDQWLVAEFTPR